MLLEGTAAKGWLLGATPAGWNAMDDPVAPMAVAVRRRRSLAKLPTAR